MPDRVVRWSTGRNRADAGGVGTPMLVTARHAEPAPEAAIGVDGLRLTGVAMNAHHRCRD
ncbi:MAG: hypothetical protein R2710_05590 [Acidimicrobiales bacterium]